MSKAVKGRSSASSLQEADFFTVCQALADLQTALVDYGTERGALAPSLSKALRDSWAKWTPSDEDPTINLKSK